MSTARIIRAISICALLGSGFQPASASVYAAPMYRGYHLDWCLVFGDQCGKPAAEAFCRANGQGDAVRWEKNPNPGYNTMTVGEDSVCEPTDHGCDSFTVIECRQSPGADDPRTFASPTHSGYRLDWCRKFEHDCGAPAAEAFCQARGFSGVSAFQKQAGMTVPTLTIAEHAVCDPNVHGCDSFDSITCR